MSKHKENDSERHMRAVLEDDGFEVTRLAEQSTVGRMADFHASFGSQRYLIEVKEKESSLEFQSFVAEANSKGVSSRGRMIERRNGLSSIIRNAADQLRQTPVAADFRIIWMSCLHDDVNFQFAELEHTLYGLALLSVHESSGTVLGTAHCFYYHFNEMFASPDVDAVVLAGIRGGKLCVNSFGRQLESFRNSQLYKLFEQSMWDPHLMEASKQAFMIDQDINRRAPKAQWQFLKDKYGVWTSRMLESQFSGLISFDDLEE